MEVMERKIQADIKFSTNDEDGLQISINNFGHLILRFFTKKFGSGVRKETSVDSVIVFTKLETEKIKHFLNNNK